MQQQQLHIVFSHRAGGYVWFDVVGPESLIQAYQASLKEPCWHRDKPGVAAYCVLTTTFDGVAGLIKSMPLVPWKKSDGIGWIPALDDYRALMVMANQAGNRFVAEAFIQQAMATLDQPVPKFKDVQATPAPQQPAGGAGDAANSALSQFAPLDNQ